MAVAELDFEIEELPPIAGNYFSSPRFFKTDVNTGVTRDREGTRVIGLTDDFLLGFHKGLEEECGSEAKEIVLASCGKTWGRRYAERFAKDLGSYYGMDLQDFPMGLLMGTLTESFKVHGWGELELSTEHEATGLIVIRVKNAIMAGVFRRAKQPVDTLLAGVLAGIFSHFSGEELGAVQTDCQACGAAASRFVLTLESRLGDAESWRSKQLSHDQIVEKLAKTQG